LPFPILAKLAAEFDSGQRSPENFTLALQAYQAFLMQQAGRMGRLSSAPGYDAGDELLQQVQQVFQVFWSASESLLEYAQERKPEQREEAMAAAREGDEQIRELIWETYDYATQSVFEA